MKIKSYISITAILTYLLPFADLVSAQDINADNLETTTAILDTAIPFAIGAREGEQTIRGSFGWPTFQEGFVEGVYFRFDPDGYARFSISPRLDEDVFEVICEAATTICVAQKKGMEIGLNAQGQPQISISGVTPADLFFISDRKNELPLPNSILDPIDRGLEALLSTGGDLIVRRELETLQRHSLSGFAATITYLRWVAQNQASFIFPRGWPVPSQQTGQQNTRLPLRETWDNTNTTAQPVQNTPKLQSWQNGSRLNRNQNAQSQSNGSIQFSPRTSPALGENEYETSANIFAQEAQGRSLPADINRFEILPSQNHQRQIDDRTQRQDAFNTNNDATRIGRELDVINQTLRNLETKIDNLALRLSYELRSADASLARQHNTGSQTYQSIGESTKNDWVKPDGTHDRKSEEERLRKLVVESILKQSQQDNPSRSNAPPGPGSGEVSVKKNIVERLLEELNGTEKEEKPVQTETGNPEEFVSLSDYVNKIMQAEKRN